MNEQFKRRLQFRCNEIRRLQFDIKTIELRIKRVKNNINYPCIVFFVINNFITYLEDLQLKLEFAIKDLNDFMK
jgi:hypothetical protein